MPLNLYFLPMSIWGGFLAFFKSEKSRIWNGHVEWIEFQIGWWINLKTIFFTHNPLGTDATQPLLSSHVDFGGIYGCFQEWKI